MGGGITETGGALRRLEREAGGRSKGTMELVSTVGRVSFSPRTLLGKGGQWASGPWGWTCTALLSGDIGSSEAPIAEGAFRRSGGGCCWVYLCTGGQRACKAGVGVPVQQLRTLRPREVIKLRKPRETSRAPLPVLGLLVFPRHQPQATGNGGLGPQEGPAEGHCCRGPGPGILTSHTVEHLLRAPHSHGDPQ